tara:strand:- start:42 stop:221 length:180 start_codon:yes stop_codon:yes gene_type:complete
MNEFNELYDLLIDLGIATSEEISLVTSINGTSIDTLNNILYSRTGYRSLDQFNECEISE